MTWYGVVIASRVPIQKFVVVSLPTRMGRNLVVAHANTATG